MSNYEVTALQRAATDASIEKLAADWAEAMNLCGEIGSKQIEATNKAREIGLTLQGLCGHEQIHLSFYENLKDKLPKDGALKNFTFDAAKRCVHLANNLKQPVTTVAEAQRAIQTVFIAGGFVEIEGRSVAQLSHDSTPYSFILDSLLGLQTKLEKKIKDTPLDEMTRGSVRREIEKHKTWLAGFEAKL